MLDLLKMRELADGARRVGREPVKTQFTKAEKQIVKTFFFSLCPPRHSSSLRMRSFFALCPLLGRHLDETNSHLLERANIVGNLNFLVGGNPVKRGNDWQLKCLGLKEIKPGEFAVGLNQILHNHVSGGGESLSTSSHDTT